MKHSVCVNIGIKNEAENIRRCLNHVSRWANAVVIHDDGSTDGTLEIIQEYPIVKHVIKTADRGLVRTEGRDRTLMFEKAEQTGCTWFCHLDADEVFEDKIIDRVDEMINNDSVNLYHFHNINFWRSTTHYRVDELYNKGWTPRLYRHFPDLKFTDHKEHGCPVPYNIPNTTQWFKEGEPSSMKSDIQVLHYGFADYNKTVDRAFTYWKRDPLREENGVLMGGYVYYERMIDEKGLELKEYKVNNADT